MPDGVPVWVPVDPPPWAKINDCVSNVPSVIERLGGTVEYGWQLWELPRVLLEAEFHAIWVDEDGDRFDVTPKQLPWITRVAFLPDASLAYEGRQIATRRVALRDDPLILSYIEAADAFFEVTNRGPLADFHGYLELTPEMRAIMKRRDRLEEAMMRKYAARAADDAA